MEKFIHCAVVKHEKGDKHYLFSVGREEKITGGTKVVCDTRMGKDFGVLCGDSFFLSENALNSLCPAVGATLPLREIVGIVTEKEKKVTVTEIEYFGDGDGN